MLRKLLLFCCLLFGSVSVAFAQQGYRDQDGFRVSVLNDADEPLIGAYIYVNETAAAVTDTLGRAVIPQDKLKIGDSLSVSYIFAKDQSVVVDQAMLIKGEYEFILEESHGLLQSDEVTVKANIKRLYRRSLPMKRYQPYEFYGIYSAPFTMNITNPGDSVPSHWVAGRLEGIYTSLDFIKRYAPALYRTDVIAHSLNPDPAVLDSLQRTQPRVDYINDLPLEIITSDDTTGLSEILKYLLPRALQTNNIAFHRAYDAEPDYNEKEVYPEAKVTYGYLGKDQDTSTFRLTYSGYGVGTTSEVIVKTDAQDRFNRKILGASLSFEDTINGNSYYVNAKIRPEKLYEFSINGFDGWTYFAAPVALEYSITESEGRRVSINMNNINMRSLFYEAQKQYPVDMTFGAMTLRERVSYQHNDSESYLERMPLEKKRLEKIQQRKIQRERAEKGAKN